MVDERTSQQLRALLTAVRERPTELPLAAVVALAQAPVAIRVDRHSPEVVAYVSHRPPARFDGLSDREREVAALVAAGLRNRQIADALFISLATVKDHVHAVLAKTGLQSRAEVAAAWHGPRPDSGPAGQP